MKQIHLKPNNASSVADSGSGRGAGRGEEDACRSCTAQLGTDRRMK
ncbi:unnamed protein product [Musa hybrid cultivar]